MSNHRRNRPTAKGARQGIMGKARARMKLSANVTEEQDWYLDTPDVRLTRIFTVVILLHVIAVGGIFAFKMVDKASDASAVKISSASLMWSRRLWVFRPLIFLCAFTLTPDHSW